MWQSWSTHEWCTIIGNDIFLRRSQWAHGLRSEAARLLRLWFRIPPGVWKFVCCECCVLSGRGLCDGLITRPEESYRLRWGVVCYLYRNLVIDETFAHWRLLREIRKIYIYRPKHTKVIILFWVQMDVSLTVVPQDEYTLSVFEMSLMICSPNKILYGW
jgi:hypothetical protein